MTTEIEAKKSSVEILQKAIQQLTASTNTQISPSSADESQILTELISQLESLKDGITKANQEESASTSKKNEANEEIVKELKDVKRQNNTTHWLLSGLIVLTAIWQLSEGLLVLKVKNHVNHPFRSLWNSFRKRAQDDDKQSSSSSLSSSSSIKGTLVESAQLPLRLTNGESQKDFELPSLPLPLPSLGSGKDM